MTNYTTCSRQEDHCTFIAGSQEMELDTLLLFPQGPMMSLFELIKWGLSLAEPENDGKWQPAMTKRPLYLYFARSRRWSLDPPYISAPGQTFWLVFDKWTIYLVFTGSPTAAYGLPHSNLPPGTADYTKRVTGTTGQSAVEISSYKCPWSWLSQHSMVCY